MARNAKNTRMCTGCMKRSEKSEFLNVTKSGDGMFSVGTQSITGGRSIYLCYDEKCFLKSVKKKAFSRNFKCEIPEELYTQVLEMIKEKNQE